MFRWLSLSLLILFSSCGKPLPELTNMDLVSWRTDKDGCLGKRASMESAISQQKDKLLALDETGIIELLGKPDKNELYTRNQKFYTYFITPSPECGSEFTTSSKLIIRFNAIGLAKVITIE